MPSPLVTSVYQQELEKLAGIDRHIMCAPAAFLTAAREKGYLIDTEQYIDNLDWSAYDTATGWSRPALGRMMREMYGIVNVSWWTNATGAPFTPTDLGRMQDAGYIGFAQEVKFLQTFVSVLPTGPDGVLKLAANGYKVIVTVKPGFGSNTSRHAIILTGYDKHTRIVTIFDPDTRNTTTAYRDRVIKEQLSPETACTVLLRTSDHIPLMLASNT